MRLFILSTRWGGGQSHVPAASTPGKDPVPIVQEVGWSTGPVWTGAENLAPIGIRSPDRPVHSHSLYRLSYPSPLQHKGKGKGKAVPLQARRGPEGSRKLRFPDFVTTAQDGGKVVSLTHRPSLPPGNAPGTHFC